MGLFDRFKATPTGSRMKVPVRFKSRVERRTATQDIVFDVEVGGYFIASGGRPDFIIEEIKAAGMPTLDKNGFLPKEIEEIKKHAMKVEYPRLLGLGPSGLSSH